MRKRWNLLLYSMIGVLFFNLFWVEKNPEVQFEISKMENQIIEEEGLNQEDPEEIDFLEMQEVIQTSGSLSNEPKVSSRVAMVFDRNTKQVLFDKNADKRVKMASTTKIMTAIVVMENAKMSDVVIVDKKAAQTGRITLRIENKRRNNGR